MADEHGAFIDASGDDTELIIRGCCVRFYDTGPAIHANTAHIASGVTNVYIENVGGGPLRINHDSDFPVVTVSPTPDETLTRRGIRVGASGGTNYTRLYFADDTGPLDLRNPEHYTRLAGANSNLWYLVVGMKVRTAGLASKADRALAVSGGHCCQCCPNA